MPDPSPLSSRDCDALFAPLAAFTHVLVAVSGGVDSTLLLFALCRWARQGTEPLSATKSNFRSKSRLSSTQVRPRLSVACVDHGLRPEARHEALSVKAYAQELGCNCTILRWRGEKPQTALQEKARAMRHALLRAHAIKIGAQAIVMAHHADDQAETLLMRMASGSGPEGLSGMRPQTLRDGVALVRPFLQIEKARLVATAHAEHLTWHEDPSNQQPRFTRVRLRHLETLRQAVGLTSARFTRLAQRMAMHQEALDWMVDQYWPRLCTLDQGVVVLQSTLWDVPVALQLKILAKAWACLQPQTQLRLERLEALQVVLQGWVQAQHSGRRTLGGCLVSLSKDGIVRITGEGTRRRGRSNVG